VYVIDEIRLPPTTLGRSVLCDKWVRDYILVFLILFLFLVEPSIGRGWHGVAWLRGTDKMGSWWAGTGRVRVKIVNNVHGHLRSHNLEKRIMRCSFLARRLVVCLERVTTATIKQ
jgi:hypothetical protein